MAASRPCIDIVAICLIVVMAFSFSMPPLAFRFFRTTSSAVGSCAVGAALSRTRTTSGTAMTSARRARLKATVHPASVRASYSQTSLTVRYVSEPDSAAEVHVRAGAEAVGDRRADAERRDREPDRAAGAGVEGLAAELL